MPTATFQLSDLFFDWGTLTTEDVVSRIRRNEIDIRSRITKQDEILFKLLNNMGVTEASIEDGRITIQAVGQHCLKYVGIFVIFGLNN